MKGDFSRNTFSSRKHYSAVLMQQGRVQTDADWNEQHAIDRHRIEAQARDLVGLSGAPADASGFEVSVHEGKTLGIGPGNLYVDGVLCQNEGTEDGEPLLFEDQADVPPGLRLPVIERLPGDLEVRLAYLDVWDRHVTALDDAGIREVALGGPDTATRSRTVWQANVLKVEADTSDVAALQPLLERHANLVSRLEEPEDEAEEDALREELARTDNLILDLMGVDCEGSFGELEEANPRSTGRLLARAVPPASAESPCVLPPGAGYERLENQLYRVEVHRAGDQNAAAFKWSRDNGSVTTAVLGLAPTVGGTEISVRDLGRDETLGFANGQYVELVDDATELAGQAGPLMQVVDVNPAARTVTVSETLTPVDQKELSDFHYKLRRWDSEGVLPTAPQDDGFVELEGGIQVRFSEGLYNTGDYWLIPARAATGEIEWPGDRALPPAGIEHRYAPLALVMAATVNDERQLLVLSDCRPLFRPATNLTGFFYAVGGDCQEAAPGQPLPEPLVVGVSRGGRPVLGARVRFEVRAEDLETYDGHLETEDDGGTTVVATTDARGEARCLWTLATGRPHQRVRASLLEWPHSPLHFNASLSIAGEAVEERIRIQKVLLADDQDLRLDGLVPADALVRGVRVACDEDSVVDEQTVLRGRPTCSVTLEMPFPQNRADKEVWGEALLGFQPLVLAAEVGAEGNVILWEPARETGTWLRDRLFQNISEDVERILVRLTLKGNFIWDEKRSDAYLDGEVFGALSRSGPELLLPSGDGRRGGDFEMWFWLVPQTLVLDSVTLDDDEVTGGGERMPTGTVTIIGTAPAGGVSIGLRSSDPEVVSVPESVEIGAGRTSATFPVDVVPVAEGVRATITATLTAADETMERLVDLRVLPPALLAVDVNPNKPVGRRDSLQGTVTLTAPAPESGIEVALKSSNPEVVKLAQTSVRVVGSRPAEFQATTEPVGNPTPVTVTATLGGEAVEDTVTVVPPALNSMNLDASPMRGGQQRFGTVGINGPAPVGFAVTLDSTNPAAATVQPRTVAIPAGTTTSPQFRVDALPVAQERETNIEAFRGDVILRRQLKVVPPAMTGFAFAPTPIEGGRSSTGTVTLNGPAPSGTSVTLTIPTTNTAANFPTTNVPVQAGATQATFTATGRTFTGANRSVTVTATYLGGTRQATLTVEGQKEKEEKEFVKEKEDKEFLKDKEFGEKVFRENPDDPPIFERSVERPSSAVESAEATGRSFIRPEERPEVGRSALDAPEGG